MYKITLLITLIVHCVIALDSVDKCPQMSPMPDLELTKFVGTWYGVQLANNIPTCEIYKLAHDDEPFTYALNTITKVKSSTKNYQTSSTESLKIIDMEQAGKMRVSPLPRTSEIASMKTSQIIESNFTVVKTDYESYAVVYRSDAYVYYSINDEKNTEDCSRYTQIWSRTPALSDSFIHKTAHIREEYGSLDSLLFNLNESKNKTGCLAKSDAFDNPLI